MARQATAPSANGAYGRLGPLTARMAATGAAISALVTAGLAYATYKVAETGASAVLAYATGGAAVTVPQAIGYVARSRSSETAVVPPPTKFAALPPPTTA